MILNNLKFYLRKYLFLVLVLYVQITLFLITFGTFVTLIKEIDFESEDLQQIYDGKAIYQLIDGYYDAEEYQEFISENDYITRLKNFYNGLNTATEFQYLAMYDQAIMIEDTKIPSDAYHGYERGNEKIQTTINNKSYTVAKAFQLNNQALNFFNLQVSEGQLWDKDDFQNEQNEIPVLLGDTYRNYYEIGDVTKINYYNKMVNIKVVGFLNPNSKVFYQNNTEFYLDKYILLPYIEWNSKPTTLIDEKFQQASYFAMINGYVVTNNDISGNQVVMQRIEAIAQNSSFGKYSFIGLNPHFNQYRGLMTIISEERNLVVAIFLSFMILNIFLINTILFLQQKRRLSTFAVYYMNGSTRIQLVFIQWIEIALIVFLAYITNYILLNQVMMIGDITVQIYIFILSILLSIIACFLPTYQLLRNHMITSLNNDFEGRI
ncbi:ABC transporter permease [Paenibacillus sp. Dod16]|uniref:ABC transporter permease n=1 Tax=Paenibacillus sp. Dod16 TaxID=3416392 RepID=UPI003CF60685